MTYGFRIRFTMPEHQLVYFKEEPKEITGNINGKKITFLFPNNKLKNRNYPVIVKGSNYGSMDEAEEEAILIRDTIKMYFVKQRWGFNISNEIMRSGNEDLKNAKEDRTVRAIREIHGTCIYPEDFNLKFLSIGEINVLHSQSQRGFVNKILKNIKKEPISQTNILTAFDLYGLSHFQSSLTAKFISLISAIECLSIRESCSQATIDFVDELIKHARDNYKGDNKQNIKDRLRELKKESITKSCERFINSHLGSEKASAFKRLYKIRSEFIHEGKIAKNTNMGKSVLEADEIVSQLLVRM